MSESASNSATTATQIPIGKQVENMNLDIHGINPLEMPLIVLEVFKNLNLNDIKNCRLVNNLWRTEGRKILRKESQILFHTSFGNTPCYVERLTEKIEKYLVEMREFGNENFSINGYTGWNKIDLEINKKLFEDFFPYFGAQIKFLQLAICFEKIAEFETFQQIVQSVPNIQELRLMVGLGSNVQREIIHSFFHLISNQFQKVKKVRKIKIFISGFVYPQENDDYEVKEDNEVKEDDEVKEEDEMNICDNIIDPTWEECKIS